MLALAVVAAVVLVLAAMQLGYLPPITAPILIQIRGDALSVTRGQVSATALDHVRSILHEEGVTSGYIAIAGERLYFSHTIPEAIQQRLRNVLLNRFR